MIALYQNLTRLGLTHEQGLNLLIDHNLISDHCLVLKDISLSDLKKANQWLDHQTKQTIQSIQACLP